jgi:hypothetical protein
MYPDYKNKNFLEIISGFINTEDFETGYGEIIYFFIISYDISARMFYFC